VAFFLDFFFGQLSASDCNNLRNSLLILSILCVTVSFGQTPKENLFARTVTEVILNLSRRNSAGLSNFIDKGTGVYILNTIGTKQTYRHFKTIGFSDSTYPNSPFYDKVKIASLTFASLPVYNCSTQRWTKRGLYVDTTKVDHTLSQIAKSRNKYFQDNIPTKTISNLLELETKSRRVIVAENNGNELIFHLSFLNNKWVLTVIDKVTCDCSV